MFNYISFARLFLYFSRFASWFLCVKMGKLIRYNLCPYPNQFLQRIFIFRMRKYASLFPNGSSDRIMEYACSHKHNNFYISSQFIYLRRCCAPAIVRCLNEFSHFHNKLISVYDFRLLLRFLACIAYSPVFTFCRAQSRSVTQTYEHTCDSQHSFLLHSANNFR